MHLHFFRVGGVVIYEFTAGWTMINGSASGG